MWRACWRSTWNQTASHSTDATYVVAHATARSATDKPRAAEGP